MEREVVQTDADRYIIVEYIAEGGMGAIFLGKKVGMEGFEKEVVLKQLLPEFTSQPEFIDLFLREAKLSATLDHANIVHTIDLVAAAEDYFIVMEYVRGGDLRTIMRRIKQRGHQIYPAAAIFIAREMASALAYAHEKRGPEGQPLNLIHRDVSPSNIMVSGAGEVKLTDFGIAKVSTHKSVFYRVKGKVGYMSPEQAYADRPLDHRSDLYSLAVCLHEMLSGERLFVADLLSTPDQIYGQKIPQLEGLPDIPEGIDALLAKALALDRDDRYQTSLDLQDALIKVAYDNAMIYTAPDLASHLKVVCGENPSLWNCEEEEEEGDHPGTEVLSGDPSGDQFSRVELTSVFTGLPQQLGPAPHASDLFASAQPSPVQESTRHMGRNPRGLAFEPTRLAADPTVPAAHAQAIAFDLSDSFPDDEGATYPSDDIAAPPLVGAPTSPTHQLYPDSSDAGLLAEMSGISPGMEEWTTSEEEESEPTVALKDGHSAVAMVTDLPHPVQYGAGSETPLPRSAVEAAALEGRPLDQDATVELKVHRKRSQSLEVAKELRQSRPRPIQRHPDPVLLTAHVQQRSDDGKSQRHRTLLLVAAALLLLSGVAIVILVGLTGPNLEDPNQGNTPLPDVSSRAILTPLPDSGLLPDLEAVAARSDLRAPDLAVGPTTRALKVDSSPPGARVYLDDVYQCRTPCTIEELEDDRIYLLSVRRPRYVSWSSLVDMQGKQRVHINAYLSEEPDARTVGYLLLRSTPRADVYIDGKEIGRVTSEGRIPLPPGQYEVTLHNPRRRRRLKKIVTVHARQTVALWLKF